MVRTLRFHFCEISGPIPSQGTNIPQATQLGQRKKKTKQLNGVAESEVEFRLLLFN